MYIRVRLKCVHKDQKGSYEREMFEEADLGEGWFSFICRECGKQTLIKANPKTGDD